MRYLYERGAEMMKLSAVVIFAVVMLMPEAFLAQQPNSKVAVEVGDDWYQSVEQLSPEAFLAGLSGQLGLDENYSFTLLNSKTDNLGFTHYRYQQQYKGLPVEGGELLLHVKNGAVETANGELVKKLNTETIPTTQPTEAIKVAKDHLGAEVYLWESESADYLKRTLGKEDFSFVPEPELTIADPNYTKEPENYHLAWKMEIWAEKPMLRKEVFVDAVSGEVLYDLEMIHTQNDTGIADTRYHGLRPIVTDSVSPGLYRLRESVTGNGVETYNMQQQTRFNLAVDFTDDDNYWDNVNAQFDEAATDAHFGAEATYNYFFDNFGRDSYDDQGSKLISFVHYDSAYVNAFWNGVWMTYGDGNGTTFSPLTALDVTGHEIAHGVTEFSAGLIYQEEPGALNESFSDIFGTAIEYAYDSADGDWFIGEEFNITGNGFRSMRNPKAFGDPDTYGGVNFGYGTFIDHGYVHSNSGVQNYWFYLLTDGASGVNDFGEVFRVDGIGINKSEQIAYRNLAFYLTSSSDHLDARAGSIQAARDLYGDCSNEVIQTTNAWYAVNVGTRTYENDLSLIGFNFPDPACGLDSSEPVTVIIGNIGCAQNIAAGDSVDLAYVANGGDTVMESFVLSSPLAPGNTVSYTFNAPADLSQLGTNTLSAYLDYRQDTVGFNDSIVDYSIVNRVQQNTDVGISSILAPTPGCDILSSFQVEVELFFAGCDSLAVGEAIQIDGDFDGTGFSYSYSNLMERMPGDTFAVLLPTNLPAGERGVHTINVFLSNPADNNPDNDSILGQRVLAPFNIIDQKIGFETNAFRDSLIISTNPEASVVRTIAARNTGFYGVTMTGGDPLDYREDITIPNLLDVWISNEDFAASLCGCVDATNYSSLSISFDLRQRFSRVYEQLFNQDYPYASSLRVLINGVQIDSTFAPETYNNDDYTRWMVNLDPYAGNEFELCFETRNLMRPADNWVTGDGDLAQLDNILVSGDTVIGLPELSQMPFAVFPNPSEEKFQLRLPALWKGSFEVRISDMGGKLLLKRMYPASASGGISIKPDLQSGVYLLRVKGDDFNRTQKIIVR